MDINEDIKSIGLTLRGAMGLTKDEDNGGHSGTDDDDQDALKTFILCLLKIAYMSSVLMLNARIYYTLCRCIYIHVSGTWLFV